uniref:(California timema) hypothetical protein n=1 Tax=Timema californicum TaxID=61474 RepID=A0A7R9J9Y1_TIMCA|nr:unnamed protein product [Timema californicum]
MRNLAALHSLPPTPVARFPSTGHGKEFSIYSMNSHDPDLTSREAPTDESSVRVQKINTQPPQKISLTNHEISLRHMYSARNKTPNSTHLASSWALFCEVWDLIDVTIDRRDMWSTPVARYCNDLIDTLIVDLCDTLTKSADVIALQQPTVEMHTRNQTGTQHDHGQLLLVLAHDFNVMIYPCRYSKLVPGMSYQGCDSAVTSSGKPIAGGKVARVWLLTSSPEYIRVERRKSGRQKSGLVVIAGRGGSGRCPWEFNDIANHLSLVTCSAQFCAIIYKLYSSGENFVVYLPCDVLCDELDARKWFESDGNDPGYKHLNDEEIAHQVIEDNDNGSNVRESDNDEEMDAEEAHSDAYEAIQTAMNWLERQPEGTATQLVLLKRLRDVAAKKPYSAVRAKLFKHVCTTGCIGVRRVALHTSTSWSTAENIPQLIVAVAGLGDARHLQQGSPLVHPRRRLVGPASGRHSGVRVDEAVASRPHGLATRGGGYQVAGAIVLPAAVARVRWNKTRPLCCRLSGTPSYPPSRSLPPGSGTAGGRCKVPPPPRASHPHPPHPPGQPRGVPSGPTQNSGPSRGTASTVGSPLEHTNMAVNNDMMDLVKSYKRFKSNDIL